MDTNYIILSGPAMSAISTQLQASALPRYFALMETGTRNLIASIEVNVVHKTKILVLGQMKSDGDLAACMSFVTAIVRQYKGDELTVYDTDALVLAMALSANVDSNDRLIIDAWASLNFVVEATADATVANGKPISARFVGTNIQGLKALASASSIKFTITAK